MAEQAEEKTEPATAKRIQDAREKGEVAQSKEIVGVVILAVVLLAALSKLGVNLLVGIASQARSVWSGSEIMPSTVADYHALILHHGVEIALVLGPFLVVIMLGGVAGNLIQTGVLFTLEPFGIKLDRISPLKGLKRLLSLDRIFDLLKAFVKIGIAVTVAWVVLQPALGAIMALGRSTPVDALALAAILIKRLSFLILLGFGLFAILDLFYVRWRHAKKLRMTKQEVRDELKQREGDPKVRSRVRSMQRELSRMRMIAEVPYADVVITNPTHYAVALRYSRETMRAPKVVAKGRNHLALRIRRVAREHGVPVVENPPLAQLLYRSAPLNREVPEALYQAVAEVLAFISRLDPRRSAGWREAS